MKNRTNLQRALMLSTAIPATFAATAYAGDVDVATSKTAVDVQADINAAIAAPAADLNLTVTSAGAITGGSIDLVPSSGQGDGAIKFANDGKLGSVGSSGVTDSVGANFNGVGTPKSSNSFSATNGGLVSGGLNALNFGGTASIINNGTIYGGVDASAIDDVTIVNNGSVFGATEATSTGNEVSSSPPAPTTASATTAGVTTTTTETKSESSSKAIGGNVEGTYAGTNGTLNFVGGDGSIHQQADKASKAIITGTVYGSVTSAAGSANSAGASESKLIEVRDGTGDGSNSFMSSSSSTLTANAGGDSTVTVSGKVAEGMLPSSASISSTATGNSTVGVSGSVEGGILSRASATDINQTASRSYAQAVEAGVARTDSLTEKNEISSTAAGGSASINLTGNAKAATQSGNVRAEGRTGASVTVAKGASVGSASNAADVVARSTGSDDTSSSTPELSFTRDPAAGTATASATYSSISQSNAGVGEASVAVAGSVTGNASAYSEGGLARTTITGTIGGDAEATAEGYEYQYRATTDYAGDVADSSSTNFYALVPGITKTSYNLSQTWTGGEAAVVVDTDAALKKLGVTGVAGDVEADAVGSASIVIADGSKVGGRLSAESNYFNSTSSGSTLYNKGGTVTDTESKYSRTVAGGDASIAVGVKSAVGGSVDARGDKSAVVTNAGAIEGGVSARSLASNYSITSIGSNRDNVTLRQDTATEIYTGVGGTASIANAAGATIGGDVEIAAGKGTVTNSGGIAGSIVAGNEVDNFTRTTTSTVGDTVQTVTPADVLTDQVYTINQNNFLGGGIRIGGATVDDPFGRADEPAIKTSNVSATINLNNGSVTLGDIEAQRDEGGNRLTNTTLNLNGSGYLGADRLNEKTPTSPTYLPEAVLSQEAQELGFHTWNSGPVHILGVEAVNKADEGTFVLDLAPYAAPAAEGLQPGWSADVGAINVKAGEIQLTGPAYDPTDSDSAFVGIKGDINVDGGTLVVGRRTLIAPDRIGDSLTSEGKERITGVKVALTGDYTQTATGTTVVGVSPSLVRAGAVSVGTSNSGTEILGPIQAGSNVPHFTTPANGGSAQSGPSRIDVTGKVTLAGELVVGVTKDAIYSAGDGYTLFTYTDAGSEVSATVSQSIASPFVNFELKNDTAAKEISIAAKRTSYASAATNRNAASAAGALDRLIPTIVEKISLDSNGGAVFTTANEMGLVQDAANIISGLDWRLSLAGAQQLFNELSSAEIYGSLAAIEQNSALTESFESAAFVGSQDKAGVGFWINPVGRFARYGGVKSGASKIRDNSYGGAFGFHLGYSEAGSLGIGFAYAEHDIDARGTPESAKARTYSLGLNWKHAFGDAFHAGAQFVYGFSDFDVTRRLTLLDRTTNASFKGRQWDANVELGYDVMAGSDVTVMPYGKLALRHWMLGGFTEEGGAGIGVSSEQDSKTVFVPEIGVRLATTLQASDNVVVRPYGKLSYTFQGDIGSSRAFTYAAGGDSFTLKGVDPKGYGSLDGGINAIFNDRIGLFVQGGLNFGGSQKGAEARGGVNVRF